MKNKLKFLMVTTFYPPYNFGGDGVFVYRLSNELARRGHTVDILHCRDAYEILEKKGPKGEYPNHPNITVHSLKSRFGFLSPLATQQTGYAFFKKKKIKALITEKKFDIIHYHNLSLIGLDILAYGDGIKLYTMHEYWLICPMHILWKYGREVCTKRNCISCQLIGKRPVQWWRYSNIIQKALSHIDAFISPSLFTKKKYYELGLKVPIRYIPNFSPISIDPGEFTREDSFQHSQPYFLFVGRLEKIKGVQNLIPVFRKYTKCDLLIAGDGDYEPTLRKLAGDTQNIRFLGRLSHKELQSLYRNALAVIIPSICYEVFGMTLIEAFAMRIPVIVNNSGALPEIVKQSGGGFIYNNEDELREYMEKISSNPDLRQTLGVKGYQAYKKYWTEDCHIFLYYQLIQEIAAHRNIMNPAIEALTKEPVAKAGDPFIS